MRSTFLPKQAAPAAVCAVALSLLSAGALAQPRDPNENALLLDTRGAGVMSGTGLCWHTAYGPAPVWTSGCHADVPAPIAQAPIAQAPIAQAPVAQYVVPAALPAAAPLPVYEKVAFDANVLFDSSKSELRPAGRTALDDFVARIGGLEAQSVMAVGYADRMGSDAANQRLSEERVRIVKDYLVSKGVAADRVHTRAVGETRPSTFAAECQDANNAKNVACMQADRHVFVEISGARIAK
jgi:OOP family OmpA-OmpF porin